MAIALSILSIASVLFTVFYMAKNGFYTDNRAFPDAKAKSTPHDETPQRRSIVHRLKPVISDYVQVLKSEMVCQFRVQMSMMQKAL